MYLKWPLIILGVLVVAVIAQAWFHVGFWGAFTHIYAIALIGIGFLIVLMVRGVPQRYWHRRWNRPREP